MKYRNMSYLIGEEVEMSRSWKGLRKDDDDFHRQPDKVMVVDEYPKTLLLQMFFGDASYLRMVSKAAMYCGDVQLRHKLKLLVGKEVASDKQGVS